MKNNIALLLVSALVAVLAWAFWRYAGREGFGLLTTILLIAVSIDNVRLRRQLQTKTGMHAG